MKYNLHEDHNPKQPIAKHILFDIPKGLPVVAIGGIVTGSSLRTIETCVCICVTVRSNGEHTLLFAPKDCNEGMQLQLWGYDEPLFVQAVRTIHGYLVTSIMGTA